MLKIGLTGGIASGKSTAGKFFSACGVPVINTDQIGHSLLTQNTSLQADLVAYFGPHIYTKGKLNRKKIAARIFQNPVEKQWLEQRLHPLIRAKTLAVLQQYQSPYCILEVPLLIESDFKNIVDRILVIDLPYSLQLKRLQARDKRPRSLLEKIIAQQASQKERLYYAHEIITNDSSLAYLKKQVNILNNFYRKILLNPPQ